MSGSTEEQFESELRDILRLADSLNSVPSTDTKQFVSKQLEDLQAFLQEKQKDAEDKLREEIKQEEEDIEDLKKRVDMVTSGKDIPHLAARTDFMEVWSQLKENEWHRVYKDLLDGRHSEVQAILQHLIDVLKEIFKTVQQKYITNLEEICYQVKFPGEDRKKAKHVLDEHDKKPLIPKCKAFMVKTTPYCLGSIQKAILGQSATKEFYRKFKMKKTGSLDRYIEKCVEFSWLACNEETPVSLISDPGKECPDLVDRFDGLKKLRKVYVVQWPAVVQDRVIRDPWTLHNIAQPVATRETGNPLVEPRVTDGDESNPGVDYTKSLPNQHESAHKTSRRSSEKQVTFNEMAEKEGAGVQREDVSDRLTMPETARRWSEQPNSSDSKQAKSTYSKSQHRAKMGHININF